MFGPNLKWFFIAVQTVWQCMATTVILLKASRDPFETWPMNQRIKPLGNTWRNATKTWLIHSRGILAQVPWQFTNQSKQFFFNLIHHQNLFRFYSLVCLLSYVHNLVCIDRCSCRHSSLHNCIIQFACENTIWRTLAHIKQKCLSVLLFLSQMIVLFWKYIIYIFSLYNI